MSAHHQRCSPDHWRLILVTDRAACGTRDLITVVEQAAAGGVTCVQFRDKAASYAEALSMAQALRALLMPKGIALIINDRIDVALACGAHGIHLGQHDTPIEQARRLIPMNMAIGWSVETLGQVEAANVMDVDYLGVSPVFETPTKTDTAQPWGLGGLKRARAATRKPLVAIGAIDESNIGSVRSAGADGCAVVRALCAADDPTAAAARLRAAMDRGATP
jgi:thiamine-phosphate pyrophosphorylase